MTFSKELKKIAIWSINHLEKIIEIFRLLIVSLETLYLVCLIGVAYFLPSVFVSCGKLLSANAEILKWIPVLPLGICGFSFNLAWRLTEPLSKSNRLLYDWPEYWQLKYRRNISLVLSGLMAAVAICLWIFSTSLTPFGLGFLFLLSLGVSVIVISCLAFASFTLKEIVEQ